MPCFHASSARAMTSPRDGASSARALPAAARVRLGSRRLHGADGEAFFTAASSDELRAAGMRLGG